jgi:hypothetical protein
VTTHCTDLASDRSVGKTWEGNFCRLALEHGKSFTPHQINRKGAASVYSPLAGKINRYLLPDVTIWSHPGEHHEIKHKKPTRDGDFGLEEYRWRALVWFRDETQTTTQYTIHRHDWAGGRDVETNRLEDWVTASVYLLLESDSKIQNGPSWVNGQKQIVPIRYWSSDLWQPLSCFWNGFARNTGTGAGA